MARSNSLRKALCIVGTDCNNLFSYYVRTRKNKCSNKCTYIFVINISFTFLQARDYFRTHRVFILKQMCDKNIHVFLSECRENNILYARTKTTLICNTCIFLRVRVNMRFDLCNTRLYSVLRFALGSVPRRHCSIRGYELKARLQLNWNLLQFTWAIKESELLKYNAS